MTEQVQEAQVQESTQVESQNQEVSVEGTEDKQPSAVEQRAIEMGWRPKEEFDGEETDFIDAQEFVRRKPLFDKIEYQSKELKEVKKVLRSLQDHHTKVKETEFNRAVDFLKAQKKEALDNGDSDRVVELDDQIAVMRDQRRIQSTAVNVQEEAAQIHPEFASWVSQNKWYAQDKSLRSTADALGTAYAKDNPDVSPADVLKYVSEKIKRLSPEKFQNPNRNKTAAVDGGNGSTKVSTGSSGFQLSEEETRVMNQFVRAGILTKDQYIADIKSMRGDK